MMQILIGVVVAVALALSVLVWSRRRAEARIENVGRLLEAPDASDHFAAPRVDDLPEPARRYLLHTIEPGTPLAPSVRLSISGSIRLSRNRAPVAMESREILAPPRGYVWRARVKQGAVTIRGFDAYVDGEGEMRWWLAGVVPVVRADGADVSRSAVGRLLGEAFLLPSVLLPSRGARWEAVDESTARVRLSADGEAAELRLEVNPDGSLRRLSFDRWNADPANGPVGYLTFASDGFGDERTFDGYTIPTRFRAGWRLGEAEEFPFYFARVADAEYGGAPGGDASPDTAPGDRKDR